MDTHDIFTILLKTAFTKVEVLRRIRLLRDFLERKFFVTGGKPVTLEDFLKEAHVSHDDALALEAIEKKLGASFTKDHAYGLTKALSEEVKALPVVGMFLPAEPNEEEMAKVGAWVRENLNALAIIEVHISPSFLGGCAMSYNGMYQEYTLDYFMQKNHNEIKKIIEKYVSNRA
jgi:hypothetical protein